jgi:predicted unusual protein kinase regulating ubiquinone biosynthesis (AarF/ABC1/UbiB family)
MSVHGVRPGGQEAFTTDGPGRRDRLFAVPAALAGRAHAPPMARRPVFRTSILGTALRLLVWVFAAIRYLLGGAGDLLLRRRSIENRARRLRRIFEGLGPTFVKLGQQLSVRADVLPYEYCVEFSEMLDSAPPMRAAQAIAVVEAAIGRPLAETFKVFDESPIGSASLSCVYRAQLHGGDWVAVKVRRPGVGARLASELRALGWLLQLGELLTLLRPGLTRMLRTELGTMLLEELDFRREARNAEVFLRNAEEDKQEFVLAPRVYFDLSSETVLVAELVTGVFLTDLMRALDRKDEEALARIRAQGVDPQVVAQRLVLAVHWELLEGLLFHADPHPANILVQPGNRLMFIDFGSCGRLSGKSRRIWRQFYYDFCERDVQGMVERAISILEPIPPIDVEGFAKEIEAMFWDWIHAMNSAHAEWWEKAGGMMWMRFAGMARRYGVPMTPDILRIFRATFLYDTAIFRLWVGLDQSQEFRRYHRQAGKRARKRIQRAIAKRVDRGLTNHDYVRLEELQRMVGQVVTRVQHHLDAFQPSFGLIVGKVAFAVTMFLRLLAWSLAALVVGAISVAVYNVAHGRTADFHVGIGAFRVGLRGTLVFALVAWILLRRLLFRIQDIELG